MEEKVFFLDYKRQNNQGMTSGYNMISNHDIYMSCTVAIL